MTTINDLLAELTKPFHPSHVTWKPGAVKGDRALALAYADLRAYMNRLDEVCGGDWSVSYEPWGDDRIICRLTILGVTRSSTGETTNESEKSEIGGTVAEAQSFKRAAAMFGAGRYLYDLPSGWVDYDPATKKFTEKAKAKLTGILVEHYRRATGKSAQDAPTPSQQPQDATNGNEAHNDTLHVSPPHLRMWGIGMSVFGSDWDMARPWLLRQWTKLRTPDNVRKSASDLSDDEKTLIGDYMNESASALQKVWPKQKAIIVQATEQEPVAA